MSREIKCRVWDKVEKKLYPGMPLVMLAGWLMVEYVLGEDLERYEYIQFVGLKDKNGKEIYEGDIVEVEAFPSGIFRGQIKYYPNMMYFGIEDTNEGHLQFTDLNHPLNIEIFGNIYENSELL